MVIKGPSGSGKSYALNTALKFIPSEAYEYFSGMSEKALLYNKGLNLKHRYLVIGEAAGLSEGSGRAFLRQLLTEGKVRYATVQSTSEGNVGQELQPLEGPTGLILTTTANALHPEDESRMLSYHLDESPERIREALLKQAAGVKSKPKDLDTGPWFALHRFVGSRPLSVAIPYADKLAKALPDTHFRVLRDFPHILSLISAHALLHQCTRDRDQDGSVIAKFADYEAVYAFVAEPLAYGLDNAVPEQVRFVVEGVQELQGQRGASMDGVSQVKLAEMLGRDPSVISRNVAKAVNQGYLKNLTPGQGRLATLLPGDRQLPRGSVLPHPDELKGLNEMQRTSAISRESLLPEIPF
ncbi:hypothetical protein AUC69_13705 [Methyloceanibacter superfactus]|uniref:Uncharacterized protein n=1 Tax=Methyloceanibacter superfactus TaxID=1774969 RepID=A0A1E3VT11_9HYPH|nr:hypothetical protein AUC69_13705 [Methyloceanibacter superfactus]